MDRLGLKLRATMIDQPDDGVEVYGDIDAIAGEGLSELAQIVIITDLVGQ